MRLNLQINLGDVYIYNFVSPCHKNNVPPKHVCVSVMKSMAVVNLHGKEKSANVIKDLEMGETILDYQGGPNTIMKVLVREKSIFIWTSHGLK